MMTDTATIQIDQQTCEKLRALSAELQLSMQEVMAKAVEAYRRQQMFDSADRAYRALRADPEAWAEELAERRLFEGTLLDDLEDDD